MTRKKRLTLIVLLAVTSLVGIRCDRASARPSTPSSPTTPSAPTQPSSSIVGIQILDIPSNIEIGRTGQLRAVGRYQDGRYVDVSNGVLWQSSAPDICSVSADGLIAGKGAGTALIEAKWQDVSATASVECGFVITAVIHENAPTADVLLPDAKVIVVGGPQAGLTVTADQRGQVALPPVAAPGFRLQFKKRGYDDADYIVEQLPRESHLDIGMMPEPPIREDFFSRPRTKGNLCEVDFDFVTTRTGRAHAELSLPPGTQGSFGLLHVFDTYKSFIDVAVGFGGELTDQADAILPAGTYHVYADGVCGTGRTVVLEHQS